jgi:hypothetical protein
MNQDALICLGAGGGKIRIPEKTPVGGGKCGWRAEDILGDERRRGVIASAVENGELALLLDPRDPNAIAVPLCFVDYTMLQCGSGQAVVGTDAEGWASACRLVGMHSVLAGIARGLDWSTLETQRGRWVNLKPDSILCT